MRFTRITICRTIATPARRPDLNDELQTIGNALGLFGQRDKDKSRFRIFIVLLKALKRGQPLSSDDVAEHLDLTRATVIHHLDALMDAGIVESVRGGYALRVDNLEELLDMIQLDLNKTIEDLKTVARNVDKEMGLGAPQQPVKNRTPY
jgi:biotin operon repressor